MKANEKTVCPFCGESTTAKPRKKTEDWGCKDYVLVCMFCNKVLADSIEAEVKNAPASAGKLQSLLGGDAQLNKHFCRDCKYYISHPFLSRCDRHHREVAPMDDCGDFEPKGKHEVNL